MTNRRQKRPIPEGEKFLTWHRWMLDCPAFIALSGNAVKLMARLHRRFNGVNNGGISMSVREAAAEVRCSINTARKCFSELQQAGFIEVTQKGAFDWKKRHASTWRLTWLTTRNSAKAAGVDEATKEFMVRSKPTMPGCPAEPEPK